jgi:hypothetical protein
MSILCLCFKKRLWCLDIVGGSAGFEPYLPGNAKLESSLKKNIRRMQSQGKHHPMAKALILEAGIPEITCEASAVGRKSKRNRSNRQALLQPCIRKGHIRLPLTLSTTYRH